MKDKTPFPLLQVQRYQALVDDLNQNTAQLILCRLFHNEKDVDALQASRQHLQTLVLEKKSGLVLWEQGMQVLKKELGHVTRSLQKIEKEVRCVLLRTEDFTLL